MSNQQFEQIQYVGNDDLDININDQVCVIIIYMQNQNQGISISLGEHITPSSLISHPKDKRFYATSNSTLKKNLSSFISIIQYDQTADRPQLKNTSYQYSDKLNSINFINQNQYYLLSTTNTNTTKIYLIQNEDHTSKQPFIQIPDNIQNLHITKKNDLLLTTKNNILKYNSEYKKTDVQIPVNCDFSGLDPHHQTLFLCGSNSDKKITIWDLQSKNTKFKIENVHTADVIGIDFNPNKQYYFLSTHQDCIKFWDLRKFNIPIKTCQDHHTLILDAKYNINYDQLVLASYDDGTIGLFRMTSISSAPTTLAVSNRDEDGLVKTYDQHEDFAVSVAWAGFSPWLFSSVSYNSNLIVNTVPASEKHRILF